MIRNVKKYKENCHYFHSSEGGSRGDQINQHSFFTFSTVTACLTKFSQGRDPAGLHVQAEVRAAGAGGG